VVATATHCVSAVPAVVAALRHPHLLDLPVYTGRAADTSADRRGRRVTTSADRRADSDHPLTPRTTVPGVRRAAGRSLGSVAMEIGIDCPPWRPASPRHVHEWCRGIDEGPYSSVSAGERITFHNPELLVTNTAAPH